LRDQINALRSGDFRKAAQARDQKGKGGKSRSAYPKGAAQKRRK